MEEIRYVRSTPADRDAIIDFGNYIFSQSSRPHDFPVLLPKLYGPGADLSECHYLAKIGDRIVGMVGSFPMEVNIMGQAFPARGIGTVSAHPYFRGRGIMSSLVGFAVSDMEKEGVALSALGGKRQRYEHFGFEPCGTMLHFHVTEDNLLPYAGGAEKLTLVPMGNDAAMIEKAVALQRAEPFFATRTPSGFVTVCRSWNSTPLFLLENGEFCGYLVCSADRKEVVEFELRSPELFCPALSAYLAWSGRKDAECPLPPYAQDKIAALDRCCEGYSISCAESFRIFDFENITRRLLALKATLQPLCDGRAVIGIEGTGNLAVSVRSQRTAVEKTDDPADVTLDSLTAMRFLLSPMSSFRRYAPQLSAAAASWFPLPLSLPGLDSV